MAVIREADPMCHEISGHYSDREAGVIRDWPETYSAAVVDGVRYLASEVEATRAELMRPKE